MRADRVDELWKTRARVTEVSTGNLEIRWIGGKSGYLWVGSELHGSEVCLFHMTSAAARSLRDFLTEKLADV